jgi:hypothetical protein
VVDHLPTAAAAAVSTAGQHDQSSRAAAWPAGRKHVLSYVVLMLYIVSFTYLPFRVCTPSSSNPTLGLFSTNTSFAKGAGINSFSKVCTSAGFTDIFVEKAVKASS